MGEHGERDGPVLAHIAPDLVLVQAALVLRALEALLDLPAASGEEAVDVRAMDGLGLGHGDHVGEAAVFEEAPEMRVLAVGGILGDPGDGEPGGQGAQDHPSGELAILRSPGGAGVLALHPRGSGARFSRSRCRRGSTRRLSGRVVRPRMPGGRRQAVTVPAGCGRADGAGRVGMLAALSLHPARAHVRGTAGPRPFRPCRTTGEAPSSTPAPVHLAGPAEFLSGTGLKVLPRWSHRAYGYGWPLD